MTNKYLEKVADIIIKEDRDYDEVGEGHPDYTTGKMVGIPTALLGGIGGVYGGALGGGRGALIGAGIGGATGALAGYINRQGLKGSTKEEIDEMERVHKQYGADAYNREAARVKDMIRLARAEKAKRGEEVSPYYYVDM